MRRPFEPPRIFSLGLLLWAAVWAPPACTRQVTYIGNAAEGALPDGAPPADGPGPVMDGEGGADAPVTCQGAPLPPPPADLPWNCGSRCFYAQGLPADVASRFSNAGPDPAPETRPSWVYPLPGSVHALDIPEVTLQWRRGPEARRQESFHIRISNEGGSALYDLYVPYLGVTDPTPNPAAAIFTVPASVWRTVALDNRGRNLSLVVRAHSAVDDLVTGFSDSLPIAFSGHALGGVVTYWSSCVGSDGSPCVGAEGLERHFLGASGRTPLVRAETPAAGGQCVGCHSVSQDGNQLAFAIDYEGGIRVSAAGAPTEASRTTSPPAATTPVGFPALSPDGRFLLVAYGPGATEPTVLEIYDTAGGPPLFALAESALPPGATTVFAPTWSPDGTAIAATMSSAEVNRTVTDGDLVLFSWNEATRTLGSPEILVPQSATEYHLYPTFSPDGNWIAFATATKGGTFTPLGHPHTRLQMIDRRLGAGAEVLALANTSSQPLSPPVGQPATRPQFVGNPAAGCAQLFLAFSSQRDYGFLSILNAGTRRNQLWLSAIDLSRVGTGQDPSSPPVWLPAQRRGVDNRRPLWTARIPCGGPADCGLGADCVDGSCAGR